ncbi:uncharacterized protein B0I36DRAFT_348701 [Microdochium trichocladiopsis]|uniref:GH64 domain-containing protein n=1 Tax=Microdochium trichocladiopsis TaxID=1682393 RepID=A0A9P9BQ10_9PEZI|nr:uncharacterized protein B0I36DRAFT_348701 [Microdochium trichocladiopsis]KAH7033669.1 hypothetical protein B0I36DRAFT_348701 [Microdochium trichocladiopsis]
MRHFFATAVAVATSILSHRTALALPVVAEPANAVQSVIISAHNTLNGTAPPQSQQQQHQQSLGVTDFTASSTSTSTSSNSLKFAVHNNLPSTQHGLMAYVTGRDMSGAVVMLNSAGQWYYPDAQGSMIPVAIPESANIGIPLSPKTSEFTIPDFIESGRVYVSDGRLSFLVVTSDLGGTTLVEPSAANPADASANVNWGFVELTNLKDAGIFANISFVDFVGLVMGMRLHLASGDAATQTQQVQGLAGDAVQAICDEMHAQGAKDGQPWGDMCVTDAASGKALRVMAPNMYVASHAEAMLDYYTEYVDKVWARFAGEDLVIDTQSGAGKVACRVKPAQNNPDKQVLACDGDNREYVKPVASDIWGCNTGPFAIVASDNDVHKAVVPRLCAAFTRSELLVEGGSICTPSEESSKRYYQADPTNHYSRIIHEHQVDGKGYAFSYDDVNPDGQNAAGVVAGPSPQLLEIFVGGFGDDAGGGGGAGNASLPGVQWHGRRDVPIRRRLTRFDRSMLGVE